MDQGPTERTDRPTTNRRRRHPSFPLRLAAGLGDPEREHLLLSALTASGDIILAERCLSAEQLLAAVHTAQIDIVLASFDLHRLSDERLAAMTAMGVPLVLLTPYPLEGRRQPFATAALALDSAPDVIHEALLTVGRGGQLHVSETDTDQPVGTEEEHQRAKDQGTATIIAVAGGHGSPGRTTIALNLAAALGAVAPTILVDADLSNPSVSAYLDGDPTRNLFMLAHADPASPAEWDRALAQETQPLSNCSRQASVLCGLPKPEMRARVTSSYVRQLIDELGRRYRYVIVDTCADSLSVEASVSHVVLEAAHHILLVVAADLVGVWQARVALGQLQSRHDPERLALVINRHDRRLHYGRAEIEWALGLPAAALIPHDYRRGQRSIADQRPLILGGGSAARALIDLAGRIHGGAIQLPPEETGRRRRLVPRVRLPKFRRSRSEGDFDAIDAASPS